MRKLIIFLVVVIVLVVAADRGAKYAAESAVSKQLATSYDLQPAPKVTVNGFPFLTQAISGTYRQIDVQMAEVSRDDVYVQDVTAHLYDVRAPISEVINGARNITAARASGTATVPYAVLKKRLPSGFSVKPDGSKLKLSGEARALGLSVPVTATVAVKVGQEGVVAKPSHVTVAGGRVPGSAVADQVGFVIPVRDLPMHLQVQDVQVTPKGLQVSASADDVKFTQS